MKFAPHRTRLWLSLLALLFTSVFVLSTVSIVLAGSADNAERDMVRRQQVIYAQNQPIPKYDYSLARDLWIQFYDAQMSALSTFSFVQSISGGAPEFDCPSIGYSIARGTQLTNPLQDISQAAGSGVVIPQAEPNGLFSSPNTDGTIAFCNNGNGTVAPVYTEQKVTTFPFPVKWTKDELHPRGHWLRVGEESAVQLSPKVPAPKSSGTPAPTR